MNRKKRDGIKRGTEKEEKNVVKRVKDVKWERNKKKGKARGKEKFKCKQYKEGKEIEA